VISHLHFAPDGAWLERIAAASYKHLAPDGAETLLYVELTLSKLIEIKDILRSVISMYTLCVHQDFVAQHILTGGDASPETRWHSHHYQVEVRLEGTSLDQQGYLVDIVDVRNHLEALVDFYRDRTLNETPEFEGLNPSLEHFARIFCRALANRISSPNLSAVAVRMWEDERTWAAYRQEF
jgi:6-pyruvoyltetrahydropterin/6-carboxytetrahydropterin synthase